MKIALYKPFELRWASETEKHLFHGYEIEFLRKYVDCIYFSEMENVECCKEYLSTLKIKKEIQFIDNIEELNRICDIVVVNFVHNYEDYELKDYTGKVVIHTLDYLDYSNKRNILFEKIGVDLLLGHAMLDERSELYRIAYPEYIGKLLQVPFGYAKRFKNIKKWEERDRRAVGLGAMYKMTLHKSSPKAINEILSSFEWDHELRHYLKEHADEYDDCIDCQFPEEEMHDFSYDAVEKLNSYQMFINDPGYLNFPPARTYEGIACGCVMVAEENEIWSDLGFVADENYIAFEKNNYEQMREKITYYMENQEELKRLQLASLKLAENYSHERVADDLYLKMCDRLV